jgi:NAD(P)-dependent dehydrogenase (short-subunit alcohol dehydrogenase family)
VRCLSVQTDLSQAARSSELIVSTARNSFSHPKTGRFQIDILINNAGVGGNALLNDKKNGPIDEAQFHRQYNVNVLAPLLLTQACEPHLPHDRSGRIVNISSVSSVGGFSGQSVYGGTKAALEAMTRTWSRELADRCTVNSINPGPVWGDRYEQTGEKFWQQMQPFADIAPLTAYRGESEISAKAGDGQEEKFDRLVSTKMGGRRPAFPAEIAGIVGMLCSDESGWSTGSLVSGNGGMFMST